MLEELHFRGYLLVTIAEGIRIGTADRTAVIAGVVGSATLFGVAHLANSGATALSTLNISIFGFVLAGAYVLTDRLAIPIGIHTTWNFTLGSVFGFPASGLRVALHSSNSKWAMRRSSPVGALDPSVAFSRFWRCSSVASALLSGSDTVLGAWIFKSPLADSTAFEIE